MGIHMGKNKPQLAPHSIHKNYYKNQSYISKNARTIKFKVSQDFTEKTAKSTNHVK